MHGYRMNFITMRLPKRLNDILKRKADYLESVRNRFERSAIRLQGKLLDNVITELIDQLDVTDGVLQDTANNYRVIAQIEKVYEQFYALTLNTLVPEVNKALKGLKDINDRFFELSLSEALPRRFEKVLESAKKLTDLRLGMSGGKSVRGGFLESMLKDPSLTEVKQLVSRAVTGGMSMRELVKALTDKITGAEGKTGSLERQYQRFAYDVYQQYDRAYTSKLADEFNMEYFIYQGGLVVDSRDFCVAHNGKLFKVSDTEQWRTWSVNKARDNGEFPEGYEPKQKAEQWNDTPGYMNYPGYDPMTDFGGYNCRHFAGFITKELAEEKLKNKF